MGKKLPRTTSFVSWSDFLGLMKSQACPDEDVSWLTTRKEPI